MNRALRVLCLLYFGYGALARPSTLLIALRCSGAGWSPPVGDHATNQQEAWISRQTSERAYCRKQQNQVLIDSPIGRASLELPEE